MMFLSVPLGFGGGGRRNVSIGEIVVKLPHSTSSYQLLLKRKPETWIAIGQSMFLWAFPFSFTLRKIIGFSYKPNSLYN